MYIKVYFNDKPLFLANSIDAELEAYKHHDDAVFIDEFSPPAINSIIHEMKLQKVHAGILYHADLEKLKKSFTKKFTVINAAGGLVANDNNELLFIYRRGKWDLPKGKVDPGESAEICAVREVKEETGLKMATVEKHLLTTYHTYDESGKHMLKETDWYLMHSPAQKELHPQTVEQITEAIWVPSNDLNQYMNNTYLLIKDVLKTAGRL